ncbi:MAG: hypothetical protein CMH57_08545 [Myxococcales bacterium]|nr:hypothetical protein [Myxococcales bacterium]
MLILANLATVAGCSCDDDDGGGTTIDPSVEFLSPADGGLLSGSDDQNSAEAGVQPRFTLDVKSFTGAGEVSLSVFPDENSTTPSDSVTLEVTGAGELSTTDLTVNEGSNLIRAELLDAAGEELAKDEIRVTLNIASLAAVEITSPSDGANLTDADDVNTQMIGFQTDVRVGLTDVPDGQSIALQVNGEEVATGSTTALASSFTFQGVTLPEGAVNIGVTVSGPGLSEPLTDTVSVSVTLEAPQCEIVAISPPPLGGGACDFNASSIDAEPNTAGYQGEFTVELQNCDAAQVELLVNGQATGAVTAVGGTATTVVTLNEGENRIQATAIEGDRSGMSEQLVYLVDTEAPAIGFVGLTDGQALNFEDDRDGDLSNGLNIIVELATEGADGASPSVTLFVGDNDELTADPDGNGDVRFDDVVLDTEGEVTLTATATDACGNATSTSITVDVSLLEQALSIDSPEGGAMLGPMDDLDVVAQGLQTLFTVTAEGFPVGTEVAINCRRSGAQAFFQRGVAMVPEAGGAFDVPVTLPEGNYVCRAEVEGPPAVLSAGIDVSVVLTVAAVEITFPSEGSVVGQSPVDVTALVANAPAARATLTVGDADYTAQAVAGGLSFADVALEEGSNTLTVALDDFSATDAIDVILDTTPPVVAFTSPSGDGATVTEADDSTGTLDDGVQIDVSVSVDDANPGDEVCVTTGLSQERCATLDEDGAATIEALQVVPGQVTLTATTTDQAGNEASATLEVTVDVDRPVVTIVAPEDGAAVTSTTITVDVMVEGLDEDGELALYVNDEETPVQTSQVTAPGATVSFEGVTLLADQVNAIWATITDSTGVGASPRIEVSVDTTAPDVVFVSPTDGATLNLSNLDVDGAPGFQTNVSIEAEGVADGQPATLTVTCGDGPAVMYDSQMDNSRAAFRRVTLVDQTSCTLEASVTDRADNVGDASITVQVDRVAPTLSFVALRDGDIVSINQDDDPMADGLQLDVRVNVVGLEDGQEVCLADNSGEVDVCVDFVLADQSVFFSRVSMPDGDIVLTVSTEDAAGNSGRRSVLIRVDASPLNLSFVEPNDPVTVLNGLDDNNPMTPELETSVSVIGVEALGGSTAYLCSDTAPGDAPGCQGAGFRRIAEVVLSEGLANGFFTNVVLPEGSTRLRAETFFEPDEVWVESEEITITVDTTAPTVARLELTSDDNPADMLVGQSEDERPANPGFFGRLEAQIEGVPENTRVRFFSTNSNNAGGLLANANTNAEGVASATVRLDEGAHVVTVSASDTAGNPVVSPSLMFTVDITPPQLGFANLFDGQQLNSADDLDGNAEGLQFQLLASSNATGAEVSLARVVGTLDAPGAQNPDDVALGTATVAAGGLATFMDLTLPNGAYTLAMRVRDAAGNLTTRTIGVEVDAAVPTVAITAPATDSVFTEEEEMFVLRPGFQVAVTVQSDEIGAAVQIINTTDDSEVGDAAVIGAGGSVTVPVTLVRGLSSLEARVTDALGNVGRSSIVDLTVDIDGCGIVFSSPESSPVIIAEDDDDNPANGVNLDFEAIVDDLALCSGQEVDLVINSAVAATATVDALGVVTFTGVSLPSPSTSTVFARIISTEGDETTTVPYTVRVDVVEPTVSFVTPSADPAEFGAADDLSALGGLQTNLVLEVNDCVGGTLDVDSSTSGPVVQNRAVNANGQVSLNNLTFPEGEQTVTVTVTDRAGNMATATVDFVVDVTAPAAVDLLGEQTNARRGTSSLAWTAPGDDGGGGARVTLYELFYHDEPVTDENIDEATALTTVEPSVDPSNEESWELESLPWTPATNSTTKTWFVAARAVDDLGNASAIGDNFTVVQELQEARFTIAGAPANWGVRTIGLGDINNDTFPDVGVTHPGTQRMWILYGGDGLALPDGETEALQEISIAIGGFSLSGLAASAVGDVNGDGIDDFAVGGLLAGGGAGGALIFFGVDGGQISGAADVQINGVAASSAGIDVGPAGNFSDVDSEGIADLAIGATTGASGSGEAYVLLGREDWPATINLSEDNATNVTNSVVRIIGADSGDEFGYQVLGIADVGTALDGTADGFNELAVGAQSANSDRGEVSVFYGGAFADLSAGLQAGVDSIDIVTFDLQGTDFGGELASADVTGDGTPDLIVGAYSSDGIGVYPMDDGLAVTPLVTMVRSGAGAFGETLSTADVDDDGDLDLLAGGISRDEMVVYFNPGDGAFANPPNIRLTETSDWGRYVEGIGDINNDGLEDFIVSRAGAREVVIFY